MSNFIGIYQSADTQYCDDIVNWFNNEASDDVKVQGNIGYEKKIDPDRKDSTDVAAFDIPRYLLDVYEQELFTALDKYKEEYPHSDQMVYYYSLDPGYNVQYYKPGGGFKIWHCENSGAPSKLTNRRHLVFMTYLNDCDDGGTEFYHQDLCVKAVKGRTVIWPVAWTHTHRGQVSFTKDKYITTGWFNFKD